MEGLDLTKAKPIPENAHCAFIGTQKGGPFDIDGDTAREWLAHPNPNGKANHEVVRPWCNGSDLVRRPSDTWVVDFGCSMSQGDASLFETPFFHVQTNVFPKREGLKRDNHRVYWWLHAEDRPGMRAAQIGFPRYIATPRVAKHRVFVWQSSVVLPDSAISIIARADDTTFGILHSRFHELWSLSLCTWLGVGNDPRYTPTTCFETFPFPTGLTPRDTAPVTGQASPPCMAGEIVAANIAAAARRLNELRENWLNPAEWVDWVITPEEEKAGFPKRPVAKPGHEADLKKRTLTNLYNARPAWLDLAHKALDQAVAAAYSWPDYSAETPDDEILRRLLSLNLERSQTRPVE
jgi:hypothetical protein